MKALYIGIAVLASFAFVGCCNLKARTSPAIPCMVNPCPTSCKPCPPVKGKVAVARPAMEQIEK
ncbi:hypothetical protein CVU37_14130 [candidate division BRC1 bacterium HGW-BRC1-1]|jgi:hypothetical protein|nr:MAG: hypothetical protein CVU37_14130 [candidate division BRC1 bacterium HGW-BRC1-1]